MDFTAATAAEVLSWYVSAEQIRISQQAAVDESGDQIFLSAADGVRPSRRYAPRFAGASLDSFAQVASCGMASRYYWRQCEERRTPFVVCSWPFDQLGPRHYVDQYGTSGQPMPEDQPRGPFLHPGARNVQLWEPPDSSVSGEDLAALYDPPARPFSIAVLGDPRWAPSRPQGTHALVQATVICRDVAAQLMEVAAQARARDGKGYRAEAGALLDHATACERRLDASMAWLDASELDFLTAPTPPFAPLTIPAQLRGYVTTAPYQ